MGETESEFAEKQAMPGSSDHISTQVAVPAVATRDADVSDPTEDVEIGLATLPEESLLRDSCDYIASNPGKQFRASVLKNAAQYGDRSDDPQVTRLAVAIELFHAATLAHDDVVDDGDLRRGKATIGARSGSLTASLAGGWLFARSCELAAEAGEEVLLHFSRAASVVCEGEMGETRELYDVDRTPDRYLAVIEAKTARLIALSSWLGAKVGGAEPDIVQRLERYGEAVGMAFQIADDVLDLVGDPKMTGKTECTDLRHGVYTLPIIYALEEDATLREILLRGPEEHEAPLLVERIRATGGIDAALSACSTWIGRAAEALPRSDPPAAGHERRLLSLARSVGARVEEMALH